MSDENKKPLINFDFAGAGEVGKALIEAVSKGCGALYEPFSIVREARAHAKASKIKVVGEIEVEEIERRALQRLAYEETRKQENIESITNQAFEYLDKDSTPDQIDGDWMARFLDKSKLISNKEMQDLWARILAGEANSPGSFSRRTIDFLYNLSQWEASLVNRLAPFIFYTDMIYSDSKIFKKEFIFAELLHLQEIGVLSGISSNLSVAFVGHELKADGAQITCQNKVILIDGFSDDYKVSIDAYKVTSLGVEITSLVSADINEEYLLNEVARLFLRKNVEVKVADLNGDTLSNIVNVKP